MDADDWNDRYSGDDLVWGVRANQFLVEHATPLDPGVAIDVACGEGRNAVWLAQQGWRVFGFDFASKAIDVARRLAEHHSVTDTTEFTVGDALTWHGPIDADLVAVIYLQLPVAERTIAMERHVGALAPGGRFLFVGHDASNIEHGYGGPQSPDVLASPDEYAAQLTTAAARVGVTIDVERAEVVPRTVDTDDGPRTALDTLVRAIRA